MTTSSPLTVLWFGTGSMTAEILPAVNREKLNIPAFIDERPERRQTLFAGAPVIGIEDIPQYGFDWLLVGARPYELIADKLRRAGVRDDKIVSLDFENVLCRKEGVRAEHAVAAVLGRCPALGDAFSVRQLLRSSWFSDSGGFFAEQAGIRDDDFFTGARSIEGKGEDEGAAPLDVLSRPLSAPDMPGSCRSMQIELSALCGYRCFCCASHKATRAKGLMSLEDLRLLAQRMGSYSGQAALHHGGEPLLDPDLPDKIALLRRAWPKADISFVSTLGVEVEEKRLDSLWEKGLDDMEVSFYGYDRETYKDIHGVDGFELARKNLLHLLSSSARRAAGGTVCIRMLHVEESGPVNPRHYADNAARFRDKLLEYAGVRAVDTYLSSHSGQGPIQRKRATVLPCGVVWGLFRDRINVTWDMNVVPCCQDFDNNIVLGNLRHDSVEDIFAGPVYRDFFHAHWSGDLSAWPLCRNCERSVSGTRSQLTRVAVWKIANILQNSPKKDETLFAVIGEPGLAGPAAVFFRRNFSAYRSLPSAGAALPADLEYVFIVARNSAQSAYYAETLERRCASACRAVIVPVIGVGYHVRTAVAEGLASIYAELNGREA